MAANLPETGILPTAARWFLQCRPALNPPKDIFFIRIRPLAPGDHILSQKLLLDISVYTFASKNQPMVA